MQRVGIPISSNIGGDVFESFSKINDIIKKNDGIRSFSVKTNSCYDSDAPVTEGTQTHIRITNNFHDINQLGDSFLRMKWTATVKFEKETKSENNKKQVVYFIGWKNACEAIRQLEVENNNVDCEYLQTESMKEGCAYSAYMPEEEKKSRRFAHSRWEAVENYEPGQAGTYIVLNNETIGAGKTKSVSFETIIPITDLLQFQAFEEFPGSLGDIVLKFYFSKQGMVYGGVDPNAVENALHFWDGQAGKDDEFWKPVDSNNSASCALQGTYTRGFVQCGQGSRQLLVNSDTGTSIKIGYQNITIDELKLVNCYCDVYGYNITQECKRNLASLFTPEHPMIIPAQHLDVKQMPKLNTATYDADFTYALHNVTDFIVVWPRRNSDQTCFYNPLVKTLQLRVDGKLFPTHKLETTNDYRFYQMMMNASDLDNYYEADRSYSNSLLADMPAAWDVDCCVPHDISTFLCTFQAERNTAGYCFDGIETGNQTVNIALSYNSTGSWYQSVGIAPQIWFTRDTYWTCDNVNGLKYHKTGTPPIYASSED